MLFTMGLETLGLGIILPMIKVIFDQQFLEKYFFLSYLAISVSFQ